MSTSAPGPLGTLVEQVERFPIPPQPRYTIVAWSNKVTYQYIDRRKEKPKGAVPSFDLKSHVSLGVFPIPPGDLLPEGGGWTCIGRRRCSGIRGRCCIIRVRRRHRCSFSRRSDGQRAGGKA